MKTDEASWNPQEAAELSEEQAQSSAQSRGGKPEHRKYRRLHIQPATQKLRLRKGMLHWLANQRTELGKLKVPNLHVSGISTSHPHTVQQTEFQTRRYQEQNKNASDHKTLSCLQRGQHSENGGLYWANLHLLRLGWFREQGNPCPPLLVPVALTFLLLREIVTTKLHSWKGGRTRTNTCLINVS